MQSEQKEGSDQAEESSKPRDGVQNPPRKLEEPKKQMKKSAVSRWLLEKHGSVENGLDGEPDRGQEQPLQRWFNNPTERR